jgi:hypothetical protein
VAAPIRCGCHALVQFGARSSSAAHCASARVILVVVVAGPKAERARLAKRRASRLGRGSGRRGQMGRRKRRPVPTALAPSCAYDVRDKDLSRHPLVPLTIALSSLQWSRFPLTRAATARPSARETCCRRVRYAPASSPAPASGRVAWCAAMVERGVGVVCGSLGAQRRSLAPCEAQGVRGSTVEPAGVGPRRRRRRVGAKKQVEHWKIRKTR